MAGLAGLRSLLEPGLEVPVKERGEKIQAWKLIFVEHKFRL
jgi:hypothetical protein